MADEFLYFLPEDMAALEGLIRRYEGRRAVAAGGIHESTTQSSETWHDNPMFDTQQQEHRMNDTEVKKLKETRSRAILVDPTKPCVGIGTRVRIVFEGDEVDQAECFTVVSAVNYGDKEDSFGQRVSYVSPMGSALVGRRDGEQAAYSPAGSSKVIRFRIVEVLPAVPGPSATSGLGSQEEQGPPASQGTSSMPLERDASSPAGTEPGAAEVG